MRRIHRGIGWTLLFIGSGIAVGAGMGRIIAEANATSCDTEVQQVYRLELTDVAAETGSDVPGEQEAWAGQGAVTLAAGIGPGATWVLVSGEDIDSERHRRIQLWREE